VARVLVATPAAPRSGRVRLERHAFADASGPYLAVGASLFWGGWGCLHDRDRFERNLAFLSGSVDYIRVLGVVGPKGWRDRAALASDLEAAVPCVTDLAYQHGLRTQWTIFGSVDTVSTPEERAALMRRFAAAIRPRIEKVQLVEVANEAWQNGFAGEAGRREARELARLLRELTPVATIAITAPQPGDETTGIKSWYEGSDATVVTIHPDRDQRGADGKWRPVRQLCNASAATRLPWIANEPIGPQSSVAEDADPLRLTMAAGLTWLCGGAAYTLHTGAGVRGGGAEDRARARVANLWEVPNINRILSGIDALRRILPADLPNFTLRDPTRDAEYPFEAEPIRQQIAAKKFVAAYAATSSDGRFVMMAIGLTGDLTLTARAVVHATVFDPLTSATVESRELRPGATLTVPSRSAAVIVGRR